MLVNICFLLYLIRYLKINERHSEFLLLRIVNEEGVERRGDSPHSVLRFIPHRRSIFVVENVVVHFILVARQAVEKDPVVAANIGSEGAKEKKRANGNRRTRAFT